MMFWQNICLVIGVRAAVIPKSRVVSVQESVRVTDSPRRRTEPLQPELHSATPRSPSATPAIAAPRKTTSMMAVPPG